MPSLEAVVDGWKMISVGRAMAVPGVSRRTDIIQRGSVANRMPGCDTFSHLRVLSAHVP